MSMFDDMANAQLLAFEGQQQIASELARGIKRLLARLLDRCLPTGTMAPW